MLYEFHTSQNAKKPRSIHATYLLTGKKRDAVHTNGINGTNGRDGEDTTMASSPPYMSSIPSSMPNAEEPVEMPVPKTSIVLVREEELEKTKAEFDEVTSIQIYSLEPGPIENLNILSVCNHEIATEYASEDPLEQWRIYGSIHNPYIKKRVAKFAPAPPTVAKTAPKPAVKPSVGAQPKEKEATAARRGSVSGDNTSERSTPQPTVAGAKTVKKTDSKANLKRSTSDIFKSFAKSKPPKAKEAEKSKESTPVPPEDGKLNILKAGSQVISDVGRSNARHVRRRRRQR
jgi:DNA polymerase delta subunit 3